MAWRIHDLVVEGHITKLQQHDDSPSDDRDPHVTVMSGLRMQRR